jgi:hypothetical protein
VIVFGCDYCRLSRRGVVPGPLAVGAKAVLSAGVGEGASAATAAATVAAQGQRRS